MKQGSEISNHTQIRSQLFHVTIYICGFAKGFFDFLGNRTILVYNGRFYLIALLVRKTVVLYRLSRTRTDFV